MNAIGLASSSRRVRFQDLGIAVGIPVAAGVIALLLSGALALVVGASPLDAYSEMLLGAFGSTYAVGNTAAKAVPLILVGCGFAIAFRSGVFNIGLEGQLYIGALAATLVGTSTSFPAPLHLVSAVVAGAIGGGLWALPAIALKVWRNVSEVVTSLLLTYVAILLVSYLVSGPMQGSPALNASAHIAPAARLPILVGGTPVHAGLLLAVGAVIGTWWVMGRSVLGFELRTVGANPMAAVYAGISLTRSRVAAFLISGCLAGLAGASEILGSQYRLVEDFSPGWGYSGIVVALLGSLNPVGVLAAGGFFAVLESGADQMQATLGVPSTLALVIQGLAVLMVLASGRLRNRFLGHRNAQVSHQRAGDDPAVVASAKPKSTAE